MNRLSALTLIAAPALLLLSACGGNGYGTASPAPASTTTTGPSPGQPSGASPAPAGGGGGGLHVASTSLGRVLVDGSGRTVYLLTADGPHHSTCDASCLQYWPPVAGGHAAKDVTGAVGTTKATDGTSLATVGGWPLYTFVQDTKPGDVTGQGMASFGGIWYAVSPSGQPVKSGSAGTPSSGYTKPATGGGGY